MPFGVLTTAYAFAALLVAAIGAVGDDSIADASHFCRQIFCHWDAILHESIGGELLPHAAALDRSRLGAWDRKHRVHCRPRGRRDCAVIGLGRARAVYRGSRTDFIDRSVPSRPERRREAARSITPSMPEEFDAFVRRPKALFKRRRPTSQEPRPQRACASSRHKGRRTPRSARSG